MLRPEDISLAYFLAAVAFSAVLVFRLPYVRGSYKRNVYFTPPPSVRLSYEAVVVSDSKGERRDAVMPQEADPEALEITTNSNFQQADILEEAVTRDRDNSTGILAVEGHVTFDRPNASLPSGNLPHNPGKRVDRLFRESVRQGIMTQFDQSLHNGADITLRSTMAYTILHEAIVINVGHNVIQKLIEHCPDLIHTQSCHGTTPLMLAVSCNQIHIARLLLEKGAKVDAQDDQGHTALMLGAMRNIHWAAVFLLPWGADSELVDVDGRRAVDLALLFGNARVASDLQGSALAVVPGYIAPKIQKNHEYLSLLYTIAWHGLDVVTDVLLAMNLAESGHPKLAICTAFFLLLPSFFISLIPYQTFTERLLTLLQLRTVYEGLISMGQERLTVRFGATRLYHTGLQNVPQAVVQAYILGQMLRGDSGFLRVHTLTLGLAIASTMYQATTTIHNMYLVRFFTVNNDCKTEILSHRILLVVGVILGVGLRVAMWGSALLVSPTGAAVLFVWVFSTRFRLLGVGNELEPDQTNRVKLELTAVDLFVAFLCDMPFITMPSCYLASVLLTAMELVVVLAPCFTHWHGGYQAANALISSFWLWVTFSLGLAVYIHGAQCSLPDIDFWQRFLSPFNLVVQVRALVNLAATNAIFSLTFLYFEVKAKWANHFRSRQIHAYNEQNSITLQHDRTSTLPKSREPWWEYLFSSYPNLSWKALDEEEVCSMISVFMIVVILLCYFVSLLGKCHNVDDDSGNTFRGVQCAAGFDVQFGHFSYSVAPYILCSLVFLYFIEAVTCTLATSLRNLCSEEMAYNRYLKARTLPPSFHWYSESYHDESRTYTTIQPGGNGGSRTVTRTETIRVVTHIASMTYHFDYWTDDSDAFPQGAQLYHIQSENEYTFDSFTQSDFGTKFAKFKADNKKDVHQICTSTFKVDDTVNPALPMMLVYAQAAPYFLRYSYYLCAVLMLLAPWYRWAVASISTTQTVNIVKKVHTANPNEQQHQDFLARYGGPELDDEASIQIPQIHSCPVIVEEAVEQC